MDTPILDGIAKHARSVAKDFVAGVDPTGTYTFRYGIEDAERKERGSNIRRGIGTVGGLLAGALLVPSAVYGLVHGGIGLKKGLRHAFRRFGKGFLKPYRDIAQGVSARGGLYRAMRGQSLTKRQASAISKMLKSRGKPFVSTPAELSSDKILELAKLYPEKVKSFYSEAGKQLGIGIGSMALGGLVNASSSIAQYNAGRNYGQRLSPSERKKMLG